MRRSIVLTLTIWAIVSCGPPKPVSFTLWKRVYTSKETPSYTTTNIIDYLGVSQYLPKVYTAKFFYQIARHYVDTAATDYTKTLDTAKAGQRVNEVCFLNRKVKQRMRSNNEDDPQQDREDGIICISFFSDNDSTSLRPRNGVKWLTFFKNGDVYGYRWNTDKSQIDSILNSDLPIDLSKLRYGYNY